MTNLKESKILYAALSVLIACVLWLYVVGVVNPDAEMTVRNVPIAITGQDVLSTRGLMLTYQSVQDLDLKVQGKRNTLVNLTNENIVVTADVSGLPEAGEYELKCNISLPSGMGAVTIHDRDRYRMTVTVEERVTKTVEIRGDFTGSVAEGYQAEGFLFSPSTLELTGPASVMDKLSHALVTLDRKELTETFSGELSYTLVGYQGEIIPSNLVEGAVDRVYTVYPVVVTREVPLTVELLPGGGATEEHASVKIHPESIQISGEKGDVVGLEEIVLGTIDLAKVGTSGVFTYPINLSNELTNESGIAEATVTVKVNDLTERTVETSNIVLVNIPEGYKATPVTHSVQVTLRGEKAALDAIQLHQIRAVADLADLGSTTGQFRVPIKLYVDSDNGVGVLGGEYAISVTLKK